MTIRWTSIGLLVTLRTASTVAAESEVLVVSYGRLPAVSSCQIRKCIMYATTPRNDYRR